MISHALGLLAPTAGHYNRVSITASLNPFLTGPPVRNSPFRGVIAVYDSWRRWLKRTFPITDPPRRDPIRWPERLRLEALEARLTPAPLDLSPAGLLTFTGADVASRLTMSRSANVYAISDP